MNLSLVPQTSPGQRLWCFVDECDRILKFDKHAQTHALYASTHYDDFVLHSVKIKLKG